MERISDERLAILIRVAIKTAPKTIKQGLRSKLALQNDKAVAELAADIVSHISNDSYMVIQTGFVTTDKPTNEHLGIWGFHEPDPTDFIFVARKNLMLNEEKKRSSD